MMMMEMRATPFACFGEETKLAMLTEREAHMSNTKVHLHPLVLQSFAAPPRCQAHESVIHSSNSSATSRNSVTSCNCRVGVSN